MPGDKQPTPPIRRAVRLAANDKPTLGYSIAGRLDFTIAGRIEYDVKGRLDFTIKK